jgi:8-oxo-dGTP pyrophosphatase MutT (NUDIX family)
MGAGILPTTIHNNKLYFLFGKENKYADTPGWSDIGGGTDNDETFMQTAMREGTEELIILTGVVQAVKRIECTYFPWHLTRCCQYTTTITINLLNASCLQTW